VKVLFLDIDGVLNGHEFDDEAQSCNIRRECVKHLNRVVRETDCRIVLSSAWRYMVHGGQMTLKGFGYMLRTHGLIASSVGSFDLIIGLTRKDDESVDPKDLKADERAQQCRDWLIFAEHKPHTFAAVDDQDHLFDAHGIPAVITDGKFGMTAADADKLIELLGRRKSSRTTP
jgi:HAD domain in Swiss Army Knife RNA repair proteins